MLGVLGSAYANMYDIVLPQYHSTCKHGCLKWTEAGNGNATEQARINAFWTDGGKAAGSSCAMPANTAGDHECDCNEKDKATYIEDSYAGPWCYCATPDAGENRSQYCTPSSASVEQLNLQIAAVDVVVASFVTYEPLPSAPAEARIRKVGATEWTSITGVTHSYETSDKTRTYMMHYVPIRDLDERTAYEYSVKSGSAACAWSSTYNFRSIYATGVTRIATYGDMGHSHYNNNQNMKVDCAAGAIDAIVHMGDHAYNIGFADDRRGDAYMNAMQPLLAGCPWFPVIGNHEASDGDHYKHYEQIAAGEMVGQAGHAFVSSTATSALGSLLTKGTLYGMGTHSGAGSVPSNTSRYVSADVGLIHVVGLDMNSFDATQSAWLKKDLAAAQANRASVPWIMVTSHFPIYHSSYDVNARASAGHYLGEVGEVEIEGQALPAWVHALDGHNFVDCPPGATEATCPTVGGWRAGISAALEPILLEFGVDIYNAGHVHDYESTWPMAGGKVVQKDMNDPKAPVHITEGNGGVPGVVGASSITPINGCKKLSPGCRRHGTGGAYGRVTAWNATHLTYDHVQNNGGAVTDTFTIVQRNHGPFPKPPGGTQMW
jgi:hypothetical protein